MTQDLLVIVSVKNNALLSAMRAAGFDSAAALARAGDVSPHRIYDYLNLKIAPIRESGEWRTCILSISRVLRTLPEDLFPAPFLRRALSTNKVMREVSAEDLPALMGGGSPSIAYDPEQQVAVNAALGALDAALASLLPREARMLRMYFGLDGEAPQTLDEIGRTFGVSKERVRQTVLRAQRRLAAPRHHLRQRCAPLLEDAAAGGTP